MKALSLEGIASLALALALLLLGGCGGGGGKPEAVVFPDAGSTIDLLAAPAGKYRVKRVRAETSGPRYEALSRFDHDFASPGSPKKGDTVLHSFEAGKAGDQVIQHTARLNLATTLETTGSSASFSEARYYWEYVRSDGGWEWFASDTDTTSGQAYAALFVAGKRRADAPTIYADDTTRATCVVRDGNLLVYLEVTTKTATGELETRQIIELTYQKQ